MAQVKTNECTVSLVNETSLGVPATSACWIFEPNAMPRAGAQLTTVARTPISKFQERRKGAVVDLDSSLELEGDLTWDNLWPIAEAAFFAKTNGPGLTDGAPFRPTAVTSTGYTVAAGGDLAAGVLIYASGFPDAANNGFKVVGSDSTSTEIKTSGLVADASVSDAENATVFICGRQGGTGDLEIDSSGDLISTTLNFTTLGLTVGQFIWIGGATSGTKFAQAVNNGLARVRAIAANKLTLDKKATTFTTDDGDGKTVQIFFGQFLRKVAVDDADYLSRSMAAEIAYTDLGGVGTPEYEYALGNQVNECQLQCPLTDKATMRLGLIGTDTEPPTTSRRTGFSAARVPVRDDAFNTSSNFTRLRVTEYDETALLAAFKSLTITFRNNVSPEKILNRIGAAGMNRGIFEVDVEAQAWFEDSATAAAVRDYDTLTAEVGLRNESGQGFVIDLPSFTVGDGSREFPVNETVLINLSGQAFQDDELGYSASISFFPYLPE